MLKTIQFKIEGMHCNSCVTLITMELADVQGVTGVMVDLKTGLGSATLTDGAVSESDVLAAVERAGYSASMVKALV